MKLLSKPSHLDILFCVETHLTTEENYYIKAFLVTFEEKLSACDVLCVFVTYFSLTCLIFYISHTLAKGESPVQW